jgi:hypothetical protein
MIGLQAWSPGWPRRRAGVDAVHGCLEQHFDVVVAIERRVLGEGGVGRLAA